MQFTIKRNVLCKHLEKVQSVVEKRNAIPILANVKLECNDNAIKLTTTDMDISVESDVQHEADDLTVQEAGNVTIPVQTFYNIMKKVGEDKEVVIERDNNAEVSQINIAIGTSKFTLPTLPVEEFPDFDTNSVDSKFSINSSILKVLLSKTEHAISQEEIRYYLNGVYLHVVENSDGKSLRAVATDGHRLAKVDTLLPEGAADIPGIIIPKKTVGELIKLLDDYVGEVSVSLSAQKIIFTIGNVTLVSKLIDGKFPDYTRVIPQNNDKNLEVVAKDLAKSVELVISVSSDKTRAIKFNILPSGVTLSTTSEVNGNATGVQEINAKYSANENISIGFDSKYVLDALQVVEGDTAKISLSDKSGAVIVEDASDKNSMYILMPMQV